MKHYDAKLRNLISRLVAIIAKDPEHPRTEEVRNFILANDHVPLFRSLAVTLIMLAEGETVI